MQSAAPSYQGVSPACRPDPVVWQCPPPPGFLDPALGEEEVHLWFVNLDQAPPIAKLWQDLVPEERSRADRYYTEQLRHRFGAARAMLRQILSRYLCCDPLSIQLNYNHRGKPQVCDRSHPTLPLQFNLSHCQQYALYGVGLRAIGVDLEQIRPLENALSLAQRFFTPSEVQSLQTLPSPQQSWGFLRYWVCKEAYVKAIGEGLAHNLDQVEVQFHPQAQLKLHTPLPTSPDWNLWEISPNADTVAAVVTQDQVKKIQFWQGQWQLP